MFQRSKLLVAMLFFTSTFASLTCLASNDVLPGINSLELNQLMGEIADRAPNTPLDVILRRVRPGTVIITPENGRFLVPEDKSALRRVQLRIENYFKRSQALIRAQNMAGHEVFSIDTILRLVNNAAQNKLLSYERLISTLEITDAIALAERRAAIAATSSRAERGTRRGLGRGKAGVITGAAIGVGAAVGSMGGDEANASEMSLVPVEPTVAP